MNAEHSSQDEDKTGDALKAQPFRMLEDIAGELAGDIVFPTHFDAVLRLRLRRVLHDPDQSLADLRRSFA